MRIVFNLHRVGLGNNGGSRTIVKSAETLSSLGHEVILTSDIKNKYTWEIIDKKVNFVHSQKIPNGDVIIATGFRSVKSTILSKFKRKFYFVRGFEVWNATESMLFKSYQSLRCIVNSSWLQKMLASRGIQSDLVFNGLDFDDFYNLNLDRDLQLGCLYSKKHKTKNYTFATNCAKNLSLLSLNKDIKGATPKELNKWYNRIKVWMSPSELEGLHNPPMEASLSGCGLVSTNHPRSGTSDYVIPNKTALVYEHGDTKGAIKCIRELLSDDNKRRELNINMVNILKNKIGTREKNMKNFIEIISG